MPTSDFLKEKYKGKSLTPQADVERLINSAQRLGIEMDESEALQWLAAMAAAGTLQAVIGAVLPLAEARRAHELLEQHHFGKIVLVP